MQLKVFKDCADLIEQGKIAEVYERALDIIQPIYKEKQKSLKDTGKRDDVFREMKGNLAMFK